jgi:hypothetical protein
VLDRILIKLLLKKKKSYFRILKLGSRNVSIRIEEYIPANEMIENFGRRFT